MKQSVLFDFLDRRHLDFAEFVASSEENVAYINWNDYVLPQDYGDPQAEYRAIRSSCALCDVSPMRKVRIVGDQAAFFLDHLVTRPVSSEPVQRGIYVVLCNADGTLKDDAMLYKFAEDDYLLMPSDMDHRPHLEALRKGLGIASDKLTIEEQSDQWIGLAVQGPRSALVMQRLGFSEAPELSPYEAATSTLDGVQVRIARMGFTADLGYELWCPPALAGALMQALREVRSELGLALPGYGLAALEACRLEGGFVVAGWDFATEADPAEGFERYPQEVGLGWLVDLDAIDFVGKQALLAKKQHGFRYLLRTFHSSYPAAVEDGTRVFARQDDGEQVIGTVNCSAWSWGLEKTIGNVSIEREFAGVVDGWISVDGARYSLQLGRGAHIDLERRNQIPAETYFPR
ncbi:MAG: aminomethyltransferase family protein [Pseudomonadota bacterium]